MKLKYYMRGLGLGIILTTLILVIGNPKEKLTDQEIKARAEQLGMVMNEDDTNLDKVMDQMNITLTPVPSPNPTLVPTITPTVKPTAKPTPKPKPTKAPAKVKNSKVNFTINSGMSSRKVAEVLEKKGLVKTADDFDHYLQKKGKAASIRVGTYTVKKNASYDEIINSITK